MKQLLAVALIAIASSAGAITPCPQITSTVNCPVSTVCLSWTPPTTKESGALLDPSEIAGYEVTLNQLNPSTVIAPLFNYPVPPDQKVTTSDSWSVVEVGSNGTKSKPISCAQPVTVTGPKSPASAPTGLGIIIGG